MKNKKKFLSLLMVVAMGVQGVPVFPVLAAETEVSQGQTLYSSVKADFQSVTYEDFFTILNPRVSSIEKLNTRTELTKELGRTPTDEEIDQRVRQVILARLDMRDSFEKVKSQLDEMMPRVLDASWSTTAQNLRNNKVQILLGLTYLDRYYSFSINGISAMEILLYNLEVVGSSPYDALSIVSGLGNGLTYTTAKGSSTADVYENYLSWVTEIDDITGFVETMAKAGETEATGQEFLENQSKAVIQDVGTSQTLFEKMKQDIRLKQYLLPLLNLSSESIYVISTDYTTTFGLTSTYGGVSDLQFPQQLEKASKAQQAFLGFWQRISTTKAQLNISPQLLLIDTLAVKGTTSQTASQRWSAETGETADPGVREFITPTGNYRTYLGAGAEASLDGNLIQFFIDQVLTDTGINTYTHELTHVYDQTVWLNGRNRRTNCGNETFARGLFESENNTQTRDGGNSPYAPIFNLNTAYELGENRIQNQSPKRFQTTSDIQEYMHGVMDVLYTLDVIEAEEILKCSNADKALLLNRVSLVEDPGSTGRMLDSFTHITETEASTLETIDDLVEENIVSGRLIPKGSQTEQIVNYNDYVVVPMFEGVYAGVQNDNGMVGDFLFRRYAHELLAEYGWEEGLIAYASDQYDNDQEALREILDEKYQGNLKAFKKDMLQQRAEKMEDLKPTATYDHVEEMRTAIREALQKDLASIKAGIAGGTSYYMMMIKEVQNVKADIFKEYLLQTDDFRTSIYQEKIIEPETPGGDNTQESEDQEIEITEVSLNETSLELPIGAEVELLVTITPSDATNQILTWSSSDETVATVAHGVVTTKKEGTAVIQVTTENNVSQQCTITVKVDKKQQEVEMARQTLQEFIELAMTREAQNYTMESWQQFQQVVTEVTVVKDDAQATKQQLENAKLRLEEVLKALVEDTAEGENQDQGKEDITGGENQNQGKEDITGDENKDKENTTEEENQQPEENKQQENQQQTEENKQQEQQKEVQAARDFLEKESVNSQEVIKAGTVFEDEEGIYQFKIKNNTEVIFTGVKKNMKKVKIANTVQYAGKTFKVTAVASKALKDNKVVTTISVGNNVKNIGVSAFEGCLKLKKITLGNQITKMGNKALKNCKALAKVTIPKKITEMGKSVFEGCGKLSKITVKAIAFKKVGKNAFKGIHEKSKIKVPKKNLAKYKKLFKNKGQSKKVKIY